MRISAAYTALKHQRVAIHHNQGENHAVKPVHHAAVAGENLAVILDSAVALEQRRAERSPISPATEPIRPSAMAAGIPGIGMWNAYTNTARQIRPPILAANHAENRAFTPPFWG